jgi:hypothetical protein
MLFTVLKEKTNRTERYDTKPEANPPQLCLKMNQTKPNLTIPLRTLLYATEPNNDLEKEPYRIKTGLYRTRTHDT